MRVARYRVSEAGNLERLICVVNDVNDSPPGWFPSELEAAAAVRIASPAPSSALSDAPAASRPTRGRPRK